MEKRVLETIKKRQLLTAGDKVLIAVSGGPDSLSLLHLLHKLAPELRIKLHLAHINHGLRSEAAAEALAIKKWALQMHLPVTVSRINVKSIQEKQHLSVEAAAREGRYQALLAVAQQVGASRIATGHHRDDRVETLLLRLITGSGLDGLKGIPSRRSLAPGIEVIRPLYDVPRKQIEAYCRQKKLQPLWDPSNAELVYLRNRVRLHLLPFLEREFGPHIRRTLAQTTELLAADSSLIAELTAQAYATLAYTADNGTIVLKLDLLSALAEPLQARLVRQALWQAGAKRIGHLHVQQVLAVMQSKSPSARCLVPGGIVVQREYKQLLVGWLKNKDSSSPQSVSLQVPGRTYLPWSKEWLEAELIARSQVATLQVLPHEAYCAADKLQQPLTVRIREPGDRVKLLGSPGSRKVKKILIDKKIPQHKRDQLPVVIAGEEIIWLGGVDIAHAYRVTADTKQVLHLKITSM
ncbi:MAG TPA: tRNA lysidine(34) synthetase TilS [Oscillospiraceae bacterium]|nr:tRNA lysidine(34) synthetase TilS [Oscillospiraceae bacterium]